MSAATTPPDKPARRAVLSYVLTTVFGAAVVGAVALYGQVYQADRVERTAEVDKFVEAANAMDPLVRKFVKEVKAGKLTPETREAIRQNLQLQRGQLENVEAIVSAGDKAKVAKYQDALGRADTGIKNATGPLDSREYAQAVADIADQREPLYTALRRNPLPLLG